MFDVSGKVAIITGGCGGMGLAIARALLQNNIKGLVLVDLFIDKGNTADWSKYENKVVIHQADITDKKQLTGAFEKSIEVFNQLDIVFNNAGILSEVDPDKTVAVNLIALINGTKLAMETYLPKYRTSFESLIVNTASVAGLFPVLEVPVYSATKSAVVDYGQTTGAPSVYEKHKSKVITICPGTTDSQMMSFEYMKQNLDEDLSIVWKNFIDSVPFQTCDQLAQCVMRVIKVAETASVWIIDGGVEREVKLQSLYTPPTSD